MPVAAKEIQTAAHQMTVLKSLLASMTGRAANGGLQLMNYDILKMKALMLMFSFFQIILTD